jgi:hypothetical protein
VGDGELSLAVGLSVDPVLSLPLPPGLPAAAAPGCCVPGEGPTGFPAARGVVLVLCPVRAFAAAAWPGAVLRDPVA